MTSPSISSPQSEPDPLPGIENPSRDHPNLLQTLTLDKIPEQTLAQGREPDHRDREEEEDDDEEEVQPREEGEEDHDHDHRLGESTLSLSPPSRAAVTSPTHPTRRHHKRKKGTLNKAKLRAIEKKVQTLMKSLKPIPFVPPKALDLDKHGDLLKRLGLWDYVHIEFDTSIRIDLVSQLIANYDHRSRCSYVNGFRINLNRPTLGRALKLPMMSSKKGLQEAVVLDLDRCEDETGFIEELLSNWVLLHGEMWMMPNEVMNWTRDIKDGHYDKVDWAGLVWFMVEKELSQGQKLVDCYYASHLQYFIKTQREEVFLHKPSDDMAKEGAGEVVEELHGNDDVAEEPNVELTLGQENVEKAEAKDEDAMDVEGNEVEVGVMKDVVEAKDDDVAQENWIVYGRKSSNDSFLQRCNRDEAATTMEVDVGKLQEGLRKLEEDEQVEMKLEQEEVEEEAKLEEEYEEEIKVREEEEDEEEEVDVEDDEELGEEDDREYSLTPRIHGLGPVGLNGNLLQGMDNHDIPFSITNQFDDRSHHMGGPLIFGNSSKREIDHDHDLLQDPLNGSNKRLRTDDESSSSGHNFVMCMNQMQHWMERASMMYGEKETAFEESRRSQEMLISVIQQKNDTIAQLQQLKFEELQKKDEEILKLERELFLMGNLVEGYRSACKETQRAFSEYRKRAQLREETWYKDAGPGGLVLSVVEIEKQRLQKEEEDRKRVEEEDRLNRLIVEIKDFEEKFVGAFEGHLNQVQMLNGKLIDLEKDLSQSKVPRMVDCDGANEG